MLLLSPSSAAVSPPAPAGHFTLSLHTGIFSQRLFATVPSRPLPPLLKITPIPVLFRVCRRFPSILHRFLFFLSITYCLLFYFSKAASETSSFRTHGTWTRKLIPDSVDVSQGTYELPPLNVQGIASDLVTILMAVGTMCLGVAVYGACSSRRSKKWDSVYDGEHFFSSQCVCATGSTPPRPPPPPTPSPPSTRCPVGPYFLMRRPDFVCRAILWCRAVFALARARVVRRLCNGSSKLRF